jgi:SRSO17 transposase
VFLAYAAPGGVALVDRDLYLPKSWTDDRARCQAAGVPEEVGFQTKPQLGQVMVERALAAGCRLGG